MLCLDEATYHSEGGDSGGPVFSVIDDTASTARMAGIHSSRRLKALCMCYNGLYTPTNIIYQEFPQLIHLPQ
jgi:hypothetical protein